MGNSSATSVSGGCSKTTIVAEKETGSHVLDVKEYSVTKDQVSVGNSICSGVFHVGGHKWILVYFPDGTTKESAGYISIFLKIKNPVPNADVKARFCFSLLNHAGEPVSGYTLAATHLFSSTQTWGYDKFIERKKLESSCLKDGDGFQIRCDLTVFKGGVRTETRAPPPPVPPPDLHRHLGSLLASKVGGDVVFEVDGGELFTAHRCVLAARSPAFMEVLFGPKLPEATDHVVHARVRDMEAGVFRCMLHFIYTDSLPEMDAPDNAAAMLQNLLVAADRYDLQRLKLICEDMLRRCMDVGLAATTLVLAEQHGCQGLKAACFKFLRAPGNLKAVMATDGFRHLKSTCPSLLEELLAQVAP